LRGKKDGVATEEICDDVESQKAVDRELSGKVGHFERNA
jgi:hypothetical protein